MSHNSPVYNSSYAIRQEIQRFESVHPSIYAIYDLIESIPDRDLQEKIQNYVVCIEDSFVNSQEWTLNRGIPELRLGVLGTAQSGKSALVHRYLTGSYMLDESPEGGRFKKEVSLPDAGSCLLLIRDEGGPPDAQFAAWCDACIFVFALDCAESLDAVYQYYGRVAQCRSLSDLPLLLVGTQDTISESRPRVIDEMKTRKAAQDLRRCPYFETCATYGHNVDRVFQEACHRMMASARCHGYGSAAGPTGRPSPSHQYQQQQQQPHRAPLGAYNLPQPASHASGGSREHASVAQYYEPVPHSLPVQYYQQQQQQQQPPLSPQQQQQLVGLKTSTKKASDSVLWEKQAADSGHSASIVSGSPYYSAAVVPNPTAVGGVSVGFSQQQQQQPAPSQPPPLGARSSRDRASYAQGTALSGSEQPVQCSSSGATPTQARKSRRRSNLFSRKEESAAAAAASASAAAATTSATPAAGPCSIVGSGRAIPLKQGVLSKRSGGGALSRSDWKEKYAALSDDGLLTYYASQRDYRADSHGKSIDLSRTTVKVPGQTRPTSNGLLLKTQHSQHQPASQQQQQQHPHRRAKSSGRAGVGADTARTPDDDGSSAAGSSGAPPASSDCEFTIVSLDSRTWQFRASSLEERDDWVRAIKQGIEVGLQLLGRDGQPAGRNGNSGGVGGGGGGASVANISPSSTSSGTSGAAVQLLRDILGNDRCADCGRPDPDWASINLGVLLCIECSGAHRQLGTHLSRVRSLALDDWPANHALVMRVIGNRLANSVWEARLGSAAKPGPESPRECKEQFIRAKYEKREFLPELPYADCPVQQQLVDAIARSDTRQVILCLALAGPAINRPYSQQDPRAAVHIAATLGQLPYLQLLLWYGADPAVRDAEGRTGHFYAAAAGKPECAEFLLLAGCPPTASGQSAYQSASGRRRSSRSAASPTSPATVEIGL